MPFTKNQQQAIDEEGKNIIVSAGAGSGKTAVLKTRARRVVLEGTHVNNLLVLTFTNAAAQSMKDKIREAIKETKGLEDELNNIDSAYISTFDAFSLSLVKKYHTKLNISNNVEITDEGVINLKKQELLDEIFDEYYLTPSKDFNKFIEDFCLKDDKLLKKQILTCYRKIELKVDKTDFLKNYFNIFNDNKINSFKEEYLNLIRERQSTAKEMFLECSNYFDNEYLEKLNEALKDFLNAKTYQEFKNSLDLPRCDVPRNSDPEGKRLKGEIFNIVKDLEKNIILFENEEDLIKDIESTRSNVNIIIDILIKLDERLDNYKKETDSYSYNDIARLAIKVIEDNPDIREELRNNFKEIMIDVYQDTSDTQERLISLISNNNVFMVGDIKQSIYRFRNANPYIFKNNYDNYKYTEDYKEGDKGVKIDLLDNFRSRREVLEDVNLLFKYVMDDKIGGADYITSHQMVFGNKEAYEVKGKTNQDYHMEVFSYDKKELGRFYPTEEEAFLIGNDIKEKINNHYKIYDKDNNILRDATYSDFVILLDRSKEFDLYKKIFEYLAIPLTIEKEESLRKEDDVLIFKNLLKFILLIKNKDFNEEFKYCYTSISRSFIYKTSDEEIFDNLKKNTIESTNLYKKCLELSELLDTMNPSKFFQEVLKRFDYDNKILEITNINAFRVRAEYFYNLIKQFEEKGNTLEDFIEYLDKVFESNDDIKFNTNTESINSVRIMTIHASKGLEYQVCYYAGFTNGFNMSDLNDRIIFDNTYGLVLPKVDNNFYKNTILKLLLKRKVKQEEIGEKIRLFYVAVTRAKEKMILVLPKEEEEFYTNKLVPNYIREGYNSIESILKSIYTLLLPYIKDKDIVATRDYLYITSNKELPKKNNKLEVNELDIIPEIVEEKHYSKEQTHIPTKEEIEAMEFGTLVHELLEELDFASPDLSEVSNIKLKNKINDFLNTDIISKYKNNNMYKEYEFIYNDNNIINHGIIDLLIEDKDKYIIIDYKLKNIDDSNYDKQLNGYRKYIMNKTNKDCICYLYSILDNKFREINYEDI